MTTDFARTKAIAAAIQTKTRAAARVHPGEDRISVKGRDGVWRDYTSDDAARAYHLKALLKDAKAPEQSMDVAEGDPGPDDEEADVEPDDDTPEPTKKPRTKRRKAK